MPLHNPAIRVSHLGKKYILGGPQEKYSTFRDAIANSLKVPMKIFQHTPPDEGFWALKNVSFEVEQGNVVGIIGRNGAGKSTLLKILSRITYPTEGKIEIRGRVGSLLEVGTGFHPELTGRENIFLSGSILGMMKQDIEQKFDEIVNFSEVEKFLDTPVKRYSSGMYVRLAFAVAAYLDTDILVVDEVLAVGDAAFQRKCLGKMDSLSKTGKTVLFVSHNISAINKLTNSCIVLQDGTIAYNGATREAVNYYLDSNTISEKISNNGSVDHNQNNIKKAHFVNVSINNATGCISEKIFYQEDFEVRMIIKVITPITLVYTGFIIENYRHEGVMRVTDDDTKDPFLSGLPAGIYEYRFKIPGKLLTPGKYWIYLFIGPYIDEQFNALTFEVIDVESRRAIGNPPDGRGYYDFPIAPEINWESIKLNKESDS
jgi:lipopolysaccharide transport system ATP-binding protein